MNRKQRTKSYIGCFRFEVFTAFALKTVFWDFTSHSREDCYRHFGGSSSLWQSNLKMEVACSSGTRVTTCQTTRRHIPEDSSIQERNRFLAFTVNSLRQLEWRKKFAANDVLEDTVKRFTSPPHGGVFKCVQ
jgi:hypothetical protein